MSAVSATSNPRSRQHEAEVRLCEIADVRCDVGERRVRARRTTSRVSPRTDPTTIPGIMRPPPTSSGPSICSSGIAPVDRAARDRAADHELVAAPRVIGAVAVRRERAAEIRLRERRDARGDAELDGGAIERGQAAAQVAEQARLVLRPARRECRTRRWRRRRSVGSLPTCRELRSAPQLSAAVVRAACSETPWRTAPHSGCARSRAHR